MKTERLIVGLVLTAVGGMLLSMARPLLTGSVPFTGDLLHFHYPLRDFYARALAAGDSFDWMPELFAGFYATGEGQLGPYHPLHLLLYRLLPLDTAFGIELIAAYPFMFAGAWLFLRRWCDRAPAAFGAMLCTFCAFTLSHGVHVNMVSIVAHVPWLLWALDRVFRGHRASGAAAIALLTGSQILLGHPQATWLSVVIELAYVAFLLAKHSGARTFTAAEETPIWSTLWMVLGGKLLGGAVGAVQLLATFHALRQSTRAAADEAFATTYALAPMQLLQLLHPYLFWQRISRWTEAPGAGDEYAAYGGAVALVLGVWWLAIRTPSSREREPVTSLGRWAAVLAVAGMWLALGARGGLYLIQTWLPLVGGFRVPARFVLLTQVGLAVLGAIALGRLLRLEDGHSAGRKALWAPWSVAAASLGSLAWLLARQGEPVSGTQAMLAVAAGPLLLGVAALLLTIAARGARWAVVALVLLAAGDQALYGIAGVVAWQDVVTRPQALSFLDTGADVPPSPYRIAHGGFPNLYTLAGYRALDGYAGMTPAKVLDYRVPQALRVAQVGFAHAEFQARAEVPGAEPLPGGWFRLPTPVARARLVARSRTSVDPARDLALIDVDREALVARALSLEDGDAGTASVVVDVPGRVEMRTEAIGRRLLVLSESYDTGWIGEVDGRITPVERVNGDFLGMVVAAGAHEVALRFDPLHLRVGRWISLAATMAALVLLVLPYRSTSSNR